MQSAWEDLAKSLTDWRVWHLLAWQEICQRYRRSTLGPFWLTASVGVQLIAIGVFGRLVFRFDLENYLAFLAVGLVFWSFWTSAITEGSNCFINAASMIVQIKRPFTSYLIQVLWKNIIILAHTSLVFVVVFTLYDVAPTKHLLWLPVTLTLLIINTVWPMLLLALLSVRYRDVPVMVQNMTSILFWTTPIFFRKEQLGRHSYLLDFNPLTHLLEAMRKPLLGIPLSELNWAVLIGMAIIGSGVTFLIFARYRTRVPYWL